MVHRSLLQVFLIRQNSGSQRVVCYGVCRELFLVKVRADDATRETVKGVAEIFKAKIVDICPDSLIFEISGEEGKTASFFDMMKTYGVIEISRTGVTALQRGNK